MKEGEGKVKEEYSTREGKVKERFSRVCYFVMYLQYLLFM